ncbi:MAG TPA: extracellular solute-binding protein [Chloroflexota bacterium]|nr:extracellular solute-binding protein [Chloroflexota bacterium]
MTAAQGPASSSRTRRRIVLGAATAAGFTAACRRTGQRGAPGGGGQAPRPGTAPVTITAQITDMNPTMVGSWPTEMAAPFKELRPNVTIELMLMPSTATIETFEKLTANLAAGTPPDIFDGPRFADWTVAKGFTDTTMDSLVKRDKFDTKVFNQEEFTASHTYQGKIAQLPYKFGGNMLAMVVNLTLLQEAGVQPPPLEVSKAWSGEQFLQAAVKLTETGPGGTVARFGASNPGNPVYTWPLLWGADWLADDVKTVTCDSATMIAGYQWIQDLAYRHHVVPQAGEAARLFPDTNLFLTGKQAIGWTGAANYNGLMRQARDSGLTIAVAPAPALKVSTPDVNSHALFLVKGGKHVEESWAVVKYFIERSRLANFAAAMTTILREVEASVRESSSLHPAVDVRVVRQILETARRGVNLKRHPNQDEMLRVLNPAMTELNENRINAGDLLRRLKPQLQSLAQVAHADGRESIA